MAQEDLQWVGGGQLLLILHNEWTFGRGSLVFALYPWLQVIHAGGEELSSRLLFDGKVLQGLSIQRSLKVSVYVDLFFSLVCNQVQMMQEQM